MEKQEMTDEEIYIEIVWEKIQRGEYVVTDKQEIYDFQSGEFIGRMQDIQT